MSFVVGGGGLLLSGLVGGLSPMLLAIVIGIVAGNVTAIPEVLRPGLATSAKTLLRWGVVLLGFQLSIPQIAALGPMVLIIMVSAVTVTFLSTVFFGKLLRVDNQLTTLIAAGFSICGAAAVAGVQAVIKAKDDMVAAAVGLVVLFGTLMIPISVALVNVIPFSEAGSGVFIGGTVHEVAQVVAAAGIAGGTPLLAVAVPVKLARVLLLAPITAGISLCRRGTATATNANTGRPPLIPLFVVGFIVAVCIATTGLIPAAASLTISTIQQLLLASAMFALGTGVHVKSLVKLGARPLLLGALATITICAVTLAGIYLWSLI